MLELDDDGRAAILGGQRGEGVGISGMNIVDSHAHIMLDPYASLPPVAPEEVMEGFARYGVEQAWFSSADALVHNDIDYHRRSNDRMAELQSRFAPHFVALATVHPRARGTRRLASSSAPSPSSGRAG